MAPLVARAQAVCEINGEEVPCPELSGALVAIPILFMLIGLVGFVFWVMMLVHAVKNPIKDKAVWIIVILLFNLMGAVVYYFAVKRGMRTTGAVAAPPAPTSPPA